MSNQYSIRSTSNRCIRFANDHSSLLKRVILFLILTGLMAFNLYFFRGSLAYYNRNAFHPFAFPVVPLAAVLMAAAAAIMAYALFSRFSIDKCFLMSILCFGITFTFLFPPATIPDEPTHFYSAYYLSNFFCCPGSQRLYKEVLFRESDCYVIENVFSTSISMENLQASIQNFQWFDHSSAYVALKVPKAISVCPLGYLVPAIAIAIGRLFHLGTYPLFYLGRLSNVLLYTVTVYAALRRAPYGKAVIFVLSFLPMSQHLIASYSYDGHAMGISMLFLANFLYWMNSNQRITTRDYVIMTALAVLLSLAKCTYAPLIAVVFLIPNARFSDSSRKAWARKAGIIAVCFVVFLLFYLPTLAADMAPAELTYMESESYSIGWVLHHIPGTVAIFVRTLFYYGDRYIFELMGHSLGWFELELSRTVLVPFFVYLLLAASVDDSPAVPRCRPGVRLALMIAVLVSGGLVFASMFFTWTDVGNPFVIGLQGRYFLPLVFPMFLIAENRKLRLDGSVTDCLCAMVLASCYIMTLSIFSSAYLH